MSDFQMPTNVTVGAATGAIDRYLRDAGNPVVDGCFIASMWALADGKTPIERPVVLPDNVEKTFLGLFNAVFDAVKDPGLSWYLRGGWLTMSVVWPAEVVTKDLAEANAYLKQEHPDREKALELFEKAVLSAPYDTLKDKIEYTIAEIQLGNYRTGKFRETFPNDEPREEKAVPIFRKLMLRRSFDADVCDHSVCQLTELLLGKRDRQGAKELLESAMNSDNFECYFTSTYVYGARVSLEMDDRNPQGSLTRVRALRTVHPESRMFQKEVETWITILEKQVRGSS